MKQWEKPILNSLSSASTESCANFMSTLLTGNFICISCSAVHLDLKDVDADSIDCCDSPNLRCYSIS